MIVIVVVFITIVVMVVVMLSGMFAMPLATALIMPMHPVVMVFPPRPGYPHPFVATVPIARTIGVIRPITHVDREPDRHGAWPDQHANRQESHCKNRKFRFHSVVNCSYEDDSLAASYRSKSSAAETIVNVAATLGASRVIVGAPQRNAIVNLPRGNVLREVSRCTCEFDNTTEVLRSGRWFVLAGGLVLPAIAAEQQELEKRAISA